MSNVSKPNLIAVICSDLHLTLQAPACRAEADWLEVQAGYLKQLKAISHDPKYGRANTGVPILCAGDVFDRWNPAPELIHFALKHLPDGMICVPGQHDLPNHRRDLMHRSGYGVLVQAGKIVDISVGKPVQMPPHMILAGFGWEQEIIPPEINDSVRLNVALIHRYCWITGYGYPGAPEAGGLSAHKKNLRGYDAAFFGDNHQTFFADAGSCRVMNVGGFIRRKSDEIEYRPSVGALFSDGTIKRRYLDTSGDKFHQDSKKREEIPVNMKEFIDSLEGLGEQGLDFREAVRQHLRNGDLKKPVQKLIEEIMEQA